MRGVSPARFVTYDTHVLPGIRHVINVPSPAVGTDWSITVPGGKQWRLTGGSAVLTTGVTVSNRNMGVQYWTQGIISYFNFNGSALAASSSGTAVFCPATAIDSIVTDGSYYGVPINPTWIASGDNIQSYTVNLKPVDQWSAINLVIEEIWITDEQLTNVQAAIEADEQRTARELQAAYSQSNMLGG